MRPSPQRVRDLRFNDIIDVYRGTLVPSDYGQRRDWETPRRIISSPGIVLPVWSGEKDDIDRELSEISVHIYLKPTDIKASDRVRVNGGDWYEVYAQPIVWKGRTASYMRITARRVTNG